ncbi:MAG: hypothetical protein PHV23_04640 [Candidatus Gracilibacteria bacterium]|nr:hypothetical protein [Candidatus Gracilibacteria bacterium]
MIGFALGREHKLSIAEILAVFPEGKAVYFSKDILILDGIDKDEILKKANSLGGTIKIIEIIDSDILDDALKSEGKFKYGISTFGDKKNLKEILNTTKKILKENGVSSRFVNKDFTNLSSAQILGEKLVQSGTDYNFIFDFDKKYIGKTIWIQDIYNYSKRDFNKDRDMQTGMLPPKLCQMMINLSGGKNIYDPFVGLGTILIESILMGNKKVYGSDLNQTMVENSRNNINNFAKENHIVLEDSDFIKLNAKFINESNILLEKEVDAIVTEGYLGEIMTQKNISIERIEKQKESLLSIYDKFFLNLKNIDYKGNLVVCFPFWEINSKYIYFEEVYKIINEFCDIQKLFPDNFENITTKAGSLLYKREKQLVGREIFKLKIKA